MGWLELAGSIKLQVSFAEYRLFYRALLQKETYISIDPTDCSHPTAGAAAAQFASAGLVSCGAGCRAARWDVAVAVAASEFVRA